MRPQTSPARLVYALVLLVSLTGCASLRGPARAAGDDECDFTVVNRTGSPLVIRQFRERSAIEIGAINPSETISGTAACNEGSVYVVGSPIPMQVGVPAPFRPVYAAAELVPGERARVSLFWP